jgi:tetratricopeptide (TPR) repeat protein
LHKHHIFIYRDKTRWNVLAQWCLKLTEDLDPVSHIVALEAYCLYRAGSWADANRKIDDAVNQTPRDPLVLSVQAYILYDMNSLERAEVIVEKALSFDQNQQFIQPLRLKGFICQKAGRKDCEQQMWPRVLKSDALSLAGLAGQARMLIADKKIKEAKKFLLKGLNQSPRYIPFYSLNKIISQAEDLEKSKGL